MEKALFDIIEETTWQYCQARHIEDNRDELAYRLATEPENVLNDIASFGTKYHDEKADDIAEMIEEICK